MGVVSLVVVGSWVQWFVGSEVRRVCGPGLAEVCGFCGGSRRSAGGRGVRGGSPCFFPVIKSNSFLLGCLIFG